MSGDGDSETALRKMLASLDVQRKAMEHEADAIFLELTSPPSEGVEPMGLDAPLVDREGYPRADIDVYRARTQRNRFRVLKTDHKEIEGKIEGLLLQLARLKDPSKTKAESEETARRLGPKPKPKYDAVTGKWVVMNWDGSVAGVAGGDRLRFDNLSRNRDASNSTASNTGTTSSSTRTGGITTESSNSINRPSTSGDGSGPKRPFAKVDGIAKESPAESAGMKVGDLVTLFGTLHAHNNDRLRALAKLVPQVAAERGTIQLVVLRRLSSGHNTDYDDENKWETLTLSLRPRPFSGRGLLGCHIIPFD